MNNYLNFSLKIITGCILIYPLGPLILLNVFSFVLGLATLPMGFMGDGLGYRLLFLLINIVSILAATGFVLTLSSHKTYFVLFSLMAGAIIYISIIFSDGIFADVFPKYIKPIPAIVAFIHIFIIIKMKWSCRNASPLL